MTPAARARVPRARRTNAARASTPPSPLLSARKTTVTYLTDTMTVSVHTTIEMIPSTSPVVGADPAAVDRKDGLDRVQRAGADVAVDDAQRPQNECGDPRGCGRRPAAPARQTPHPPRPRLRCARFRKRRAPSPHPTGLPPRQAPSPLQSCPPGTPPPVDGPVGEPGSVASSRRRPNVTAPV